MKKLFFVLISCMAFFIIVDAGLRVFLFFKNRDAQYLKFHVGVAHVTPHQLKLEGSFKNYKGYYKFTPGKFGFERNTYYPYTINSLGFRGPEFSVKKAPGVVRVCVFGGSTTFGHGVEDGETYVYYLDKILNETGGVGRFEVINCGFPSYRMEHIYNLFSEEVVNYEPDAIVVYSAWNDAFMSGIVSGKSMLWRLHNLLYYRWMLYTLILEKYSSAKHGSALPFFYRHGKIPGDYVRYLDMIIRAAEGRGINIFLVEQPCNMPEAGIPGGLGPGQLRKLYAGTTDMSKAGVIAQRYYLKQMKLLGERRGAYVIDPLYEIERRPELFLDTVHLNAQGNRMLAHIIAKEIIESQAHGN